MRRDWARLTLLALLLIAFALRLYHLDFQELRGDEAFGFFFSQRPYAEIVDATIELLEPHPVASYFVQKAWITLAGTSEFALRYTTVWFGVLAVALIYRLGRRLALGKAASLAATVLMAVSPYLIWHAQDARMYSMSLALTLASTWLAVEWQAHAVERSRWGWALGYVAVSWLALHTHYFVAFVLVAHYLYMTLTALWARQWRLFFEWLLIQGMAFVLYLPWLVRAGETLTVYHGNGDSPDFVVMAQRALSVFAAGESVPEIQRTGLALLALLLLLLGTWRLLSDATTRRSALLLWLYLAVPLLATWISALQRPIFNERYLVAAAPPFYLLISAVLQWPRHETSSRHRLPFRFSGALLLLLLLVSSMVSLNRHYHDPAYSKTRGWRDLAAAIERYTIGLPPETVRVAQNFPDPTLWYYYDGPVEHVVMPPSPHDVGGAQATVAQMVQDGVVRVILPVQPAPNWDDSGIAKAALSDRYVGIAETRVGGWPLIGYHSLQPVLSYVSPFAETFDNGVVLTGVGELPETLPKGGLLAAPISWSIPAENESLQATHVSVQLLGPAGNLIAQDDKRLLDGHWGNETDLHTLFGLAIDPALAEGPYQLIAVLYTADDAGIQRFQTETGADAVTLWTFDR